MQTIMKDKTDIDIFNKKDTELGWCGS